MSWHLLTGYRTFQPQNFNPGLFNHETLNPRVEGLFNLRLFYHACFNIIEVWCWSFIVENAGGWKVRVESLGLKSSGVEMSWHLLTVPSPAWKISKLLNLDSWKWWLTCLYLSQGSTVKSTYSSMFIVCLYLQHIIQKKIFCNFTIFCCYCGIWWNSGLNRARTEGQN